MKTHCPARKRGFTLYELAIAAGLGAMLLGVAMSGFLFILKSERFTSAQNDLDIDVRVSMGWLRHDLRVSAMDQIVFYPEGPGPYEALSFPLAAISNGAVGLDGSDQIIWGKTVIYHVWTSMPSELRVTTFEPRINSLTVSERMAQLTYVVTNGGGVGAPHENAGAGTRVLFANLFDWAIHNSIGSFDSYSATTQRDTGVSFGSFILTNGTHQFTFTCIGKNSASTGYKLGLDSLVMSPCGLEREGEGQLPVAAQSPGVSATNQYVGIGSWSGNYQLMFPAASSGQYVTLAMTNDQWEERNFLGTGSACDDTQVEFDETLNPKDYIVRLAGPKSSENTWYATSQTRDLYEDAVTNDRLRGCAVRVLVRGEDMVDGGWIDYNGSKCYACFRAASDAMLGIQAAYIAECASSSTLTPDITGTNVQLLFGSSASTNITTWKWTSPVTIDINKSKSYIVSFLIKNGVGVGNASSWQDSGRIITNSFLIPWSGGGLPDENDLLDPTWSDRADVIATNPVIALQWLFTRYPTNGFYTSQVADTKMDAPQYTEMTWNTTNPAGTLLNFKVRTGNAADMSDATSWTGITSIISSPGPITLDSRRYVQFQAHMGPNTNADLTPKLKDVTIKWRGETRVVDVGGTFTKGPEYGIYNLTVDGQPLVKAIAVDLTIYKDVRKLGGGTNRLTSSLTTEVLPLNTGM